MATYSLASSKGKWIMVSAILASAMAFIDGTALFWLLNAYLLMLASLILVGGSLGDKLGRKRIFIIGIFIFISGSTACGLAPGVTFLIIFRVIQGIGGALMIPGSLSLISSSVNEKERGKAIGTWSAVTTVVTIGGPILGGALADAGLWRFIFFINLPIGLVALIILWFKVDESRDIDSNKTVDVPGAITIALGLALLTFGFLRVPAIGWQSTQVYVSLAAGVIFLVAFIIIEIKSSQPMMPLQLFKNLTFSGANLLTFFLYAGLGSGMLFLSLNLVQVQGYSQLQSGLTFLPFTILMISIARFAGSLADKHGPRLLLILGPAIAGAGLLVLSFVKQTTGPSAYWVTFFPGILLFGLGMSLTVAPLTTAVMGSVSNHFSGTASGVNNALTRIANVFANAIFGALAVLFFSGVLQTEIKNMPINLNQKQQVMAEAANLGNAKAPAVISQQDKALIQKAYRSAFIFSYQKILQISAALGFLGAIMSVIFIKNPVIVTQNK